MSAPPRLRRSPALAVALAVALGAAGCGLFTRRPSHYGARPAGHDRLTAVDPEEVREVHRLRALGDRETALAWVVRLTAREPRHLGLRFLRQDVELEGGGSQALLQAARELAREDPEPGNLLAAARLESDTAAARAWIDQTLVVAPDSAWAHYALAHREALDGNWGEAGRRVGRALLIDPGHLPARRLETMVLARSGEREDAIEALRRWLRNAALDPLQSARDLDEARLDLAQLYVLAGEAEAARAVLAQLAEPEGAGARVELVFAAVEQAQGRPLRALEAAGAAARQQPDLALAAVQEALLQEEWLADPVAAREAWERVLAGATKGDDLSSVLLGLRARAALERLAESSAVARP